MCYGGVLYVMAVYCVVGRCDACCGGVLCVMAVQYMIRGGVNTIQGTRSSIGALPGQCNHK